MDLGRDRLKLLTRAVDNCCRAFNQPVYHQDPIFHLSIAWTDLINTKQLPSVDCFESIPIMFQVKTIRIACGNKDFSIDLR